MVTLTILLLLVLVPASRRIMGGMLRSVLGALGIVALVARDSSGRRIR